MEKAISATDANRKFSRLLDGVRKGRSYVVTSHGQPIAKISPVDEPGKAAVDARQALLGRLRRQTVTRVGRWTRDELYEDER
ncbi:MAG: type II toxin-antitoxin system prevent-host-death family antitoxin [Acidobacteriaceae bacterium]|jgi:prevent-host-death family protein